jgi:hypothetical protein
MENIIQDSRCPNGVSNREPHGVKDVKRRRGEGMEWTQWTWGFVALGSLLRVQALAYRYQYNYYETYTPWRRMGERRICSTFSTSALDGGEWSTWRPGIFAAGESSSRYALVFPTAAARVQTRVWSGGILWWTKVALRQVFSENFGFPCQSTFHLLLHNHHQLSPEAGTIGQEWPQCQ